MVMLQILNTKYTQHKFKSLSFSSKYDYIDLASDMMVSCDN